MARRLAETKGAVLRRPLFAAALLGTALAVAIAISGSAIATTSTCTSTATLSGSAFEIDTDANLKVDNSNCIDWLASGANGAPFRSGVSAKNDLPTGSGDDSFGQGTAEDNPNPTIVDGSIPPNKSDLKAFGVFSEVGESSTANPSGKFLELFWSRVQNPSGTTNMDFELNKEFCDGTAAHCANNGTSKAPVYVTPKRAVGDKLISYDLSKGGTVPTISIRTWTGTVWGAATVISGGANATALGSVNTSTIPATQTGGTSGGLTASLGQQDPFTFGEASLAYSAIFGGSTTCGSFGSGYLKSRSSDSFSAEIKDFVAPEPVTISNCTTLTTNATASVTIGSPISDTATLSGATSNAGGTITFHLFPSLADCNAGTNEVTTSLTPKTVSGNGNYNSGNFTPSAVGTYYWTAAYSGDPNNEGKSTACGDANESSVVNKAPSSIATAQTLRPQDSATISATAGGTPTGSVVFKLFGPNNPTCDPSGAAAVFSQTRTLVSGVANTDNTTFTISSASASQYKWLVVYDGDGNHTGITSACGTENFTVTIVNG